MVSTLEMLNSSEKDVTWLQKNYSSLQKKYLNKMVAIKDGKIVAVASDIKQLLKKLKKSKIDASEVIIKTILAKEEFVVL